MSFFADHNTRGCASQAKMVYGKDAATRVAQQVEWARKRASEREVTYWTAVLEALAEEARAE